MSKVQLHWRNSVTSMMRGTERVDIDVFPQGAARVDGDRLKRLTRETREWNARPGKIYRVRRGKPLKIILNQHAHGTFLRSPTRSRYLT